MCSWLFTYIFYNMISSSQKASTQIHTHYPCLFFSFHQLLSGVTTTAHHLHLFQSISNVLYCNAMQQVSACLQYFEKVSWWLCNYNIWKSFQLWKNKQILIYHAIQQVIQLSEPQKTKHKDAARQGFSPVRRTISHRRNRVAHRELCF